MVLVVMALALGGLACSEGHPEQWSHPLRQAIVDDCLAQGEAAPAFIKRLEDGGYTLRGFCRDILTELEALYTESDWRLLSKEERDRIGSKASREIGRKIGSD